MTDDEQTSTYRLTAGRIDLADGRTLREGDTFVPTARQLDYFGTKLAPAGGEPQSAPSMVDLDAEPTDGPDDQTADTEADDAAADSDQSEDESESAAPDDVDENEHVETSEYGGYDSAANFVSRSLTETGPDGETIEESIEEFDDLDLIRDVYDAETDGRDRQTVKDKLDSREAALTNDTDGSSSESDE
jgi:hypothetical protein